MIYDTVTIQRLRALPVFSVASHLGMTLYGTGQTCRRCLCPLHDDHHPSLHLNAPRNIFKCFSCGKGGDVISLVMQVRSLSFPDACEWLVKEFCVSVTPEEGRGKRCVVSVYPQQSTCGEPVESTCGEPVCPEPAERVGWVEPTCGEPVEPTCGEPACPEPAESVESTLNVQLVTKSMSVKSEFCKSVASCGYLTEQQLQHAVQRYRLGMSRDGGVVFWQIDERQQVRTGKVMYYLPDCHRIKTRNPTWVHTLLKNSLPKGFTLHRCLFGQHLLMSDGRGERSDGRSMNREPVICIVESEKTAVICSEHFPDCIWMACGGLQMLSAPMLQPLSPYKVVIFPDTDLQGDTFRRWTAVCQDARKQYHFRYPLRISSILELHATAEQKQRKIDLVDFLFEGHTDSS